jgi:hypothetical protein
MNLDKEIINWVEYSICEKGMDIFPKSKSVCTTYGSFCERLRDSIVRGNLSKREANILDSIIANANREFCLPIEVISEICANFYIDRKWGRYIKAITLMKGVRWKLPDPRFKYF